MGTAAHNSALESDESHQTLRRNGIGVLDSGVGGLTVVRELLQLLPHEKIIYYGDNVHCPYGNRSEQEIMQLAHQSIGFLRAQGVKAVVLACNTTSSLLDQIQPDFDIPIFSTIAPVAREVADLGLHTVGVIATELTIRSGSYQRMIQARDGSITVFGESSHHLARLVDRGDFNQAEIDAEVQLHVRNLLAEHAVDAIIYGCTHYPIVSDAFERAAPGMRFLNPATSQAAEVATWLTAHDLIRDQEGGSIDLYTTGGERSVPAYRTVLERLGLHAGTRFHVLEPSDAEAFDLRNGL